MKYDVIIIGGGAAGMSAALWCDELKLSALLLESGAELGGQLLWTYNAIKNHLGIEAANGRELCGIFVKQLENRQFTLRLNSEIALIDLSNKSVLLANGEDFTAGNLIIATGIKRRKLNVAGEEKFKDKGIIESGKRDAGLMKGKKVCIVGGGDAAFENALIMAETASAVTLVHRGKDFRARAEFVEPARKNPKVTILTETIVKEIIGGERIEAVKLENLKTRETYNVEVKALLRRIGVAPNTELLRGAIDLDGSGYIKVNQNCETSIEGIFAVGDVANPLGPTISSAVGMGATAAKAIVARLNLQA